MASSRIFVKGLPPTISEDAFRGHFSAKYEITDAKLIPNRRIGYVGYKSPEEAAKAVKYFNRTFIRMSKIGVEIARPFSDETLPPSRKSQKQYVKDAQRSGLEIKREISPNSSMVKRKRSDVDESDSKLQEFLEVMRPNSKTKAWVGDAFDDALAQQPPQKVQAIEFSGSENDGEYETIPKSQRKATATPAAQGPTEPVIPEIRSADMIRSDDDGRKLEIVGNTTEPVVGLDTTDEHWIRSRTSRLLDLVDHNLITTTTVSKQAKSSSTTHEIGVPSPTSLGMIREPDQHASPVVASNINEGSKTFDPVIEAIRSNGRLFVRNLPYSASEDELRQWFEPFGNLIEIHLPLDPAGASKGFVLVQYEDPSSAIKAFHSLDGESFQGRLLHILPAAPKRENRLDEFAIAKLPMKKQKYIRKKAEASTVTFNWNSLYMNQDAVNASVAERLGVSKSELLDPTSTEAGVRQAIAETSILQETKAYFAANGVDLNTFKKRERGDTAILVKNFPYGMSIAELRKLFEEFGQVLQVLMPPTGTIAIVEFAQAPQARAALASLAYRRFKETVLFLEKAPKDLFARTRTKDVNAPIITPNPIVDVGPRFSSNDLLHRSSGHTSGDTHTATLFVRNLSFNTTSDRLTETFKQFNGFLSARINTKIDPKKPGQVLSMGFGFLEFQSKVQSQAVLAAMDGFTLDGYNLDIKSSHKGLDAAEERNKTNRVKMLSGMRTKIIIKNLPFEATKKDVRALFQTYGQLRSVRVPKKFDNSTRGFAFADFVTAREAENALEALKDTHLLGRRLVLEFAAEDANNAEEEIEKMQKKVGKQVSKIALQKLNGRSRRKFNIDGNENDD